MGSDKPGGRFANDNPSARPQTGDFLTFLAGFEPRNQSQRRGNGQEKLGDRFSGPGDHSGPISEHFRRFRARPPICDLNIVTLPQWRLLRHQHCVLRQNRWLLLQQKFVLSQQQTSVLSQQKTFGCFGIILGRSEMISNPFLHLKCAKWNTDPGADGATETTPPAAPQALIPHAPGARIT